MPIKFKQSTNTRDRATGKNKIVHFYIKQVPKEELIKYINEGQKSKIKQKCRNELDRRGVKINWVSKES